MAETAEEIRRCTKPSNAPVAAPTWLPPCTMPPHPPFVTQGACLVPGANRPLAGQSATRFAAYWRSALRSRSPTSCPPKHGSYQPPPVEPAATAGTEGGEELNEEAAGRCCVHILSLLFLPKGGKKEIICLPAWRGQRGWAAAACARAAAGFCK
jgi:hypothetical protein